MILALSLVLRLVVLHGPDNQVIEINPDEVVSLREPRGAEGQHFHKGVRCLIFTGDGKLTTVLEDCNTVMHALMGTAK